MANIGAVTSATAEVASETSIASERLAKQAADLNGMVDAFVVIMRGKTSPRAGVAALRQKLAALGAPRLGENVEVNGHSTPDLRFGSFSVTESFDVVDEIKRELGGMATVFVCVGSEFIRVSTNVMSEDGSRAIGSPLGRNAAYEALRRGLPFSGDVQILGQAYETFYEPIVSDDQVIGVCYFGNKK